ncbi:imelysin family protein [Tenacibaculum finnmarkense]|uniref:Imelysin-like domain-containing protein n=3 Tax=Tenacibaculum finnmarkense TaxID=2781243 RepID=A0A2I2MBK0_9FLAO|nr:imelysin family protein [Tenacibaculum finnmarkense]MBE7697653.1 hypothetical protein [Tenacibaculum finnmarkense genomovar ulcerans]MCD8410941.1 imelysin family protein [Tenacibaculum finnmarkense genomovar ulcerans]MCD8422579.1 imelysin family protein [Tenacibaculum finnmarkense genomovar ulcerans]MCD8432473.1 imelysin family protein [Tenacibaculum finnmarkense genomovar ulcerans]MCG8795541.1 imelysin family protein [Tenacibaculum finnmarkense]
MKKIIFGIFGILLISFVFSCKNQGEEPIVMDNVFFETYYSDNILPSLTNFKQTLKTQQTNIANFKASKSDADYKKLAAQWLVSAKAYSKTEVYNFGLIKNNYYSLNIYNYPINTALIEKNIADKSIYNQGYFSKQSTTKKGLGTLEYLLFGKQNSTEAKTLLLNDSFRMAYLEAINDELIRLSQVIIDTWEEDYKNNFANANGSTCSENAKCLSINQIINVLDMAKVTKVGKPAGFEKSSNSVPTGLQAYRSKNSLLLIQAMLAEVKDVYFNRKTNYASMVNAIDNSKKISDEIAKKFDAVDKEITALNTPLFDAINTDAKTVKPLYNALKELSILFAVDVTSILSVTVVPTDNDGD